MMFLAILGGLSGAVALSLALWMRRPVTATQLPGAGAQAQRALAEIARDLARGTISPDDARALETEIKRRALAATAPAPFAGPGPNGAFAIALAGAIIALALELYDLLGRPDLPDRGLAARFRLAQTAYENRPTQAALENPAPDEADDAGKASLEDLSLIAKLREVLKTRPDDLEGHRLLVQQEAALGNFKNAARAQARVVDLLGPEIATAEDYVTLASYLVQAAGGIVSPEAELALNRAVALENGHLMARYLLGLMYVQNGRADLAYDTWLKVYQRSEAGSALFGDLGQRLPELAAVVGTEFVARTDAPVERTRDEEAMISAMVQSLKSRIDENGGTPEEWGRLVKAFVVQEDDVSAQEYLLRAFDTFEGNAEARAVIQNAFNEGMATR